jgi:hypothetical protein
MKQFEAKCKTLVKKEIEYLSITNTIKFVPVSPRAPAKRKRLMGYGWHLQVKHSP